MITDKISTQKVDYNVGMYGDTCIYFLGIEELKKKSLTDYEIIELKVFKGDTVIDVDEFRKIDSENNTNSSDNLYALCFIDNNWYNKSYQHLTWGEVIEVVKSAQLIIHHNILIFREGNEENEKYTNEIIEEALKYSLSLELNEHITSDYYSIEDFAKLAGVTRQTLRNWEVSGKLIPEYSVNGKRKYSRRQLLELIKVDENAELKNIVYVRKDENYIDNIGKLKTFVSCNKIKNTLLIVDAENSTRPNNKAFKNMLKALQFGNIDTVMTIGRDGILPINNLDMIRTIVETYANRLIII